jgi:hypothetical protein
MFAHEVNNDPCNLDAVQAHITDSFAYTLGPFSSLNPRSSGNEYITDPDQKPGSQRSARMASKIDAAKWLVMGLMQPALALAQGLPPHDAGLQSKSAETAYSPYGPKFTDLQTLLTAEKSTPFVLITKDAGINNRKSGQTPPGISDEFIGTTSPHLAPYESPTIRR